MDRVNEHRFYELGIRIQRIRTLNPDTLVHDCLFDCWNARNSLQQLLDDPVSLQVCRPVVIKLIESISSFLPEDFSEALNIKKSEQVGFRAHTIAAASKELDAVLEAECRTLATYAVSQKGAYSTSDLIDRAEIMISEETRTKLDAAVINDIREAGRSLVFDLPTAAGFHILRAVELTMYDLWKRTKTGQSQKPSNWGKYIEQLKATHVDKKITTMLDNIRELYRNPIAHPEHSLTDSEAIALFGLGIAAIEHMVANGRK